MFQRKIKYVTRDAGAKALACLVVIGVGLTLGCRAALAPPLPAGQQVAPAVADRAQVPSPRRYLAPRRTGSLTVDGVLKDSGWADVPWTARFVDIEGPRRQAPPFATRVRMTWDDEYWYIGAQLEEPDLWATIRTRDAVIFHDNDFEIFIDPSGSTHRYVEIEVNQFATVWDLMLTRPYRDGGKAMTEWNIDGLQLAVGLDGTINDGRDTDRGWTLEMAIPWSALADSGRNVVPPQVGEQWRVNFSRVQWETDAARGGYQRRADSTGRLLPEKNWVWSPQGVVNMHLPELWGIVQFGGERMVDDRAAATSRWDLRRVYYAQRDYRKAHGQYATSLDQLGLRRLDARLRLTRSGTGWEARTITGSPTWRIHADGRVFHD